MRSGREGRGRDTSSKVWSVCGWVLLLCTVCYLGVLQPGLGVDGIVTCLPSLQSRTLHFFASRRYTAPPGQAQTNENEEVPARALYYGPPSLLPMLFRTPHPERSVAMLICSCVVLWGPLCFLHARSHRSGGRKWLRLRVWGANGLEPGEVHTGPRPGYGWVTPTCGVLTGWTNGETAESKESCNTTMA